MFAPRTDRAARVRSRLMTDQPEDPTQVPGETPIQRALRLKKAALAAKTTTGGPATPFRLTPTEEALREAQPDAFIVYRLYDVAREARVFRVRAVQPSMSQPSANVPV